MRIKNSLVQTYKIFNTFGPLFKITFGCIYLKNFRLIELVYENKYTCQKIKISTITINYIKCSLLM